MQAGGGHSTMQLAAASGRDVVRAAGKCALDIIMFVRANSWFALGCLLKFLILNKTY